MLAVALQRHAHVVSPLLAERFIQCSISGQNLISTHLVPEGRWRDRPNQAMLSHLHRTDSRG